MVSEEPRCDFCTDIDPEWSYETEPFVLTLLNLETGESEDRLQTGDWLLCWRCSTLVEARDKVGLIGRCTRLFQHKHGDPDSTEEEAAVRDVFELHVDKFMAGLKGKPTRHRST